MRRYGLLKPTHDAHTLGINAIKSQLLACDQVVFLADDIISKTKHNGEIENKDELANWLIEHHISHLGLSYRLDEKDALNTVKSVLEICQKNYILKENGGTLEKIYFAGLPKSCVEIKLKYKEKVITFEGSEDMADVLRALDLNEDEIPESLISGSEYDRELMKLAKEFMVSFDKKHYSVTKNTDYPEYGTRSDNLSLRLKYHQTGSDLPLTRLHVGPYHQDRLQALEMFKDWCTELADTKHLDILSIGSSQLTQSKFNENWEGCANGGGVPIQNEMEYDAIYEASRPMLVRTYSGTNHVDDLAHVHERSLNIAWHAMSLWWFNQLDGRGPNDLLTNLIQSEKALDFIAYTHKPYEPNTPHHFAFRGADDVTYILSAVLAARLAHKHGIEDFILQVMLNTPRYTWGITDIAKARAILELIKPLESKHFKVYLQPRAGLDFFAPNEIKAQQQLAMVSMLMDDIEPEIKNSPPLVHVVSYSEAIYMANPKIMNESIQITCAAIEHYRKLKNTNKIDLKVYEKEIELKTKHFVKEAKLILQSIEKHVDNYLSAQGFYDIYEAGYLPTPYLWNATEIFPNAIYFDSQYRNGSVILMDKNGDEVDAKRRIELVDKCFTY